MASVLLFYPDSPHCRTPPISSYPNWNAPLPQLPCDRHAFGLGLGTVLNNWKSIRNPSELNNFYPGLMKFSPPMKARLQRYRRSWSSMTSQRVRMSEAALFDAGKFLCTHLYASPIFLLQNCLFCHVFADGFHSAKFGWQD